MIVVLSRGRYALYSARSVLRSEKANNGDNTGFCRLGRTDGAHSQIIWLTKLHDNSRY